MSLKRQKITQEGHTGVYDAECGNCAYFLPYDCRRHAPSHVDGHTKYPRVDHNHWCGDWEPGLDLYRNPVTIAPYTPKAEQPTG